MADDDAWIDELRREELPESLQAFVEAMGLRPAVRLAQAFGGTYHYIPKLDKVLVTLRDRKIRAEFTGFNHRELARKYSLSETWIRQIVESKTDDRQATLFAEPDPGPPLPP